MINKLAFDLVEKINKFPKENSQKRTGSISNLQVTDWSDKIVDIPIIERSYSKELSSDKIFVTIRKERYSFNDVDYRQFNDLVFHLSNNQCTIDKASRKFIEEHALRWIINVHTTKKANQNILNYLEAEIEKAIVDRVFYFPVLNLYIPKPFKVGSVNFTYFTKEYFDNLWEKYKSKGNITLDDFDKLFRKHQGRVFASIRVKAEEDQAKSIAFNACSLSMDILKLYSPTMFKPSKKCYVDLEERININFQSDYISIDPKKPSELNFSMSAKNDPLIFNEKLLQVAFQSGLDNFSLFLIKSHIDNELSRLIKQAFTLYSRAISTFDLHFRIAQMITISESLLLEDDRKYKMEKNCKDRFCNLLYPSINSDAEILMDILSDMYQIRHKITHKAIRLRIDLQKLSKFQIALKELLNQVVIKSEFIMEKKALINSLEEE